MFLLFLNSSSKINIKKKKKMDRVDQCLNLLDDIAACYGKVLGFSFF